MRGASDDRNGDGRKGYFSHRPILHFTVGEFGSMYPPPTSRGIVLRLF
jgi:hypothetical protein